MGPLLSQPGLCWTWIYWETQPRAPQQTQAALRPVGASHPWVSPDKVGTGSMATAATAEAKYSQAVCCCRGIQERGLVLRTSREKGRAEGVRSPQRSWRVLGRMLTTVGKTKKQGKARLALCHSSPASSILGPVSQDGVGRGVPSSKMTTWTEKSTWPHRAGAGARRD